MGKRTTATERRSVENLTGRIIRTKAQFGKEVTAEQARAQAVRIAERSDRERSERKK